MASGFSGILKLTELDDFIVPSQECIKPFITPTQAISTNKGIIQIENDNEYKEKAKITLNDCLACSGCVTSAEVMLINQQSFNEFKNVLKANSLLDSTNRKIIVVSVCSQSVVSLAVKYNITSLECIQKLSGYFRKIGTDYVFDINFARNFSIIESQKEFIKRFLNSNNDCHSLPMLTSSCPGWICYAEKTHGNLVIPYISTVCSPQQIMGSLVKEFWAKGNNISQDHVYHVTVMPCFDKKLEATRKEFSDEISNSHHVDCVITTVEIEQMLNEDGIDFLTIEKSTLDNDLSSGSHIVSHYGSGSGGFAHHVFLHAAKELFSQNIEEINWKIQKNSDFQETTLEVSGNIVLRFALVYGFRNIQNLVQKLKRGKCPYHFVEIMACPSGCLNGGAQIRTVDNYSGKSLLKKVEEEYHSLNCIFPFEDIRVKKMYLEWLGGFDSDVVRKLFHTKYNEIDKSASISGIKW